jgi:hypothetical protein
MTKKEIKVLLCDPLPPAALKVLEASFPHIDHCYETLSEAKLLVKIQDYHIVCLVRDGPNRDNPIYITGNQ